MESSWKERLLLNCLFVNKREISTVSVINVTPPKQNITFSNPAEERIEERRIGKHKHREKRSLKTKILFLWTAGVTLERCFLVFLFLLNLVLFSFITILLFRLFCYFSLHRTYCFNLLLMREELRMNNGESYQTHGCLYMNSLIV